MNYPQNANMVLNEKMLNKQTTMCSQKSAFYASGSTYADTFNSADKNYKQSTGMPSDFSYYKYAQEFSTALKNMKKYSPQHLQRTYKISKPVQMPSESHKHTNHTHFHPNTSAVLSRSRKAAKPSETVLQLHPYIKYRHHPASKYCSAEFQPRKISKKVENVKEVVKEVHFHHYHEKPQKMVMNLPQQSTLVRQVHPETVHSRVSFLYRDPVGQSQIPQENSPKHLNASRISQGSRSRSQSPNQISFVDTFAQSKISDRQPFLGK